MDAVAALNEIAFWLERSRAATFKVQAFRRAAAVVAALDPEELEARARNGRLKSMKGIGDRTYTVIRQALEGDVPDYLAELRTRTEQPLTAAGYSISSALRGDLHSHSDWSDGGSPIALMVDAARFLGREYLALTDHSPNLTIANGLSAERLTAQLAEVARINADMAEEVRHDGGSGFRLLAGIEVDILENGELDQSPDMLEQLDIVVASVHSKLRADRGTMTKRMLGGINNPRTNVLGHCTGRLVEGSRGTRPESQFDAARIFAACVDNEVAIEINSRPERQDPPDNLLQQAVEAGCLFSIDSDAHAPGQLDFLQYGAERAERNRVPAERIVNTWPLDRLLQWAGKGKR